MYTKSINDGSSTISKEILLAISLKSDVWLYEHGAIKDGYQYEGRYVEFAQKK